MHSRVQVRKWLVRPPPQRRLDHLFNRPQSPRPTARYPPATPAYKTSPNIRRHLVFEKHLRLTFCQTRHEASPISGCVVSRLTEARWFQLASGWAAFSCKPGQRAMAMARPYPDANAGKRQLRPSKETRGNRGFSSCSRSSHCSAMRPRPSRRRAAYCAALSTGRMAARGASVWQRPAGNIAGTYDQSGLVTPTQTRRSRHARPRVLRAPHLAFSPPGALGGSHPGPRSRRGAPRGAVRHGAGLIDQG